MPLFKLLINNNMANTFTTTVNSFNNNKFKVCLSNFPNLTDIPNDQLPLAVIENNLKSITLPDITIPLLETHYGQEVSYSPNPIGAKQLNTFTMTYIVDDLGLNWWLFYVWVLKTRAGIAVRNDLRGLPLLRDNCIESLRVYLYDNNKQVQSKFEFKRCFLTTVSSVDLVSGESEHKTFTLTFQCENFDLKLQNKLDSCDEDTIDDVEY